MGIGNGSSRLCELFLVFVDEMRCLLFAAGWNTIYFLQHNLSYLNCIFLIYTLCVLFLYLFFV